MTDRDGALSDEVAHRRRERQARYSDRKPVWLTPQVMTDLYLRWREMMTATFRHGGLIIAHPKWEGMYRQFMEKLAEDDFWINAVILLPDRQPAMKFDALIPEDNLYVWTLSAGVQTPTQFFGNVGFGRLAFAAPRREGIQPWGEMKPKGPPPVITPDPSPEDTA